MNTIASAVHGDASTECFVRDSYKAVGQHNTGAAGVLSTVEPSQDGSAMQAKAEY